MTETNYYKRIFLTPGIASYKDNGEGILYIQKETIDEALPTLKDKPIIITHDGTEPVGKVVDYYFDDKSGSFICGFNVWDEKAQDLLDNKNWSISCYYEITRQSGKGIYHNINYDNEAKAIEFVNIAIVDNPRYQEARKVLNSVDGNVVNSDIDITNNNKGESKMSFLNTIKNSIVKLTIGDKEIDLSPHFDGNEEGKQPAVNSQDEKTNNTDKEFPMQNEVKEAAKPEEVKEEPKEDKVNPFEARLNALEEKVNALCSSKANAVEEVGDKVDIAVPKENEVEGQPKSTDEKELEKKEDVKNPVANSIKNSMNNQPQESVYMTRYDRIAESNKKFSLK